MRTNELKRGEAGAKASQHLFEAIELVRADVAKVEFWASAVEQFAQPAPEYNPDDATVWVPAEGATLLKKNGR